MTTHIPKSVIGRAYKYHPDRTTIFVVAAVRGCVRFECGHRVTMEVFRDMYDIKARKFNYNLKLTKETLKFEDLKIGQHLWVLFDNQLIVAAKFDESGYQVCGPWECGIGKNECEIIELIDVPKGHKNTSLYYAD